MPNYNGETGINYGYIGIDALREGLIDELTIYGGTNVSYNEALSEYMAEKRSEHQTLVEVWESSGEDEDQKPEDFDEGEAEQSFSDRYLADEEIYEGEKDGVKYRTSWMGGAQCLWVFESPFEVRCERCSPCVPGAGELGNYGSYSAYGLPPDWLDEEHLRKMLDQSSGRIEMEDDTYYAWVNTDSKERSEQTSTNLRDTLEDYYMTYVVIGNVTK